MTRRVLPLLSLLPLLPLAAQEPHRAILRQKLEVELTRIAQEFDGVFGAQVIDLTDGTAIGVNAELVFPQGSAIKIPILLELFRRGDARSGWLKERRPMTDAVRTAGSGIIQYFGNGTSELALEDLAVLMIVLSDNTATNMLIDEVGMDAVNRTLAELGLRQTKLQRKMIRPDASVRGEENISTPAEAAALMVRLARCQLPVSAAGCRRMREILEIPKGGPVRQPIPGNIRIAFKPGGIEGVATVWALVDLPDRPYVLTVMTNYGGAGDEAIREASAAAFEHFTRLAWSTPYGTRVRR
jgi:beta-lactamase class A